MAKICCGECGKVGSYGVHPGGFFVCSECGHEITSGDLMLEVGEVWVVDEYGTLGYVDDPARSVADMCTAIDEYMEAPFDSLGELEALRLFRDATFCLQGALRAGIPYPADG